MPDFSVDVDALDGFAGQLEITRASFDGTSKNIAGAAGNLGNPRLTAALDDFDRRWGEGRQVLDSYFSALASMTHDSAATLRAQDHALATSALKLHAF